MHQAGAKDAAAVVWLKGRPSCAWPHKPSASHQFFASRSPPRMGHGCHLHHRRAVPFALCNTRKYLSLACAAAICVAWPPAAAGARASCLTGHPFRQYIALIKLTILLIIKAPSSGASGACNGNSRDTYYAMEARSVSSPSSQR